MKLLYLNVISVYRWICCKIRAASIILVWKIWLSILASHMTLLGQSERCFPQCFTPGKQKVDKFSAGRGKHSFYRLIPSGQDRNKSQFITAIRKTFLSLLAFR